MKTNKVPFLFRPPEYLLELLRCEAKETGSTVSSVLNRIIKQHFTSC